MKLSIIILWFAASFSLAEKSDTVFADYLFNTNYFYDAAIEYERIIFNDPSKATAEIKYNLAQCYWKINRSEKSLRILNDLSLKHGQIGDKSNLLAGEILVEHGKYGDAISRLSNIVDGKSLFIKGYAYWKLNELSLATQAFSEINASDSFYNKSRQLVDLLKNLRETKNKSYMPAALMAIIPGCGHLYTGRSGDAAFSALLVGTLGGLAYFYYSNDSKAKALAAGTLCGIFYTGSIYGALMGVKIYNREEKAKYQKKIDEIYFSKDNRFTQ